MCWPTVRRGCSETNELLRPDVTSPSRVDRPDCWGQREAANDSMASSGRSSSVVSITVSTSSSCFTVRNGFPVVYGGL